MEQMSREIFELKLFKFSMNPKFRLGREVFIVEIDEAKIYPGIYHWGKRGKESGPFEPFNGNSKKFPVVPCKLTIQIQLSKLYSRQNNDGSKKIQPNSILS
ncbi:hypothetical protein RF11_13117 [Thelohanellus kitauei]|uniref:Uncharacterized protein n=1 Tax=Thelohanellus kitauei TaxID=669202 RepID=A0A0C2NA57_THEKT|nr:hypothetical protein RF11_13117 [Thelohanellus kitauei]